MGLNKEQKVAVPQGGDGQGFEKWYEREGKRLLVLSSFRQIMHQTWLAALRLAGEPHRHTDACFAKRITEGGKSVEYMICGKVAGAPQEAPQVECDTRNLTEHDVACSYQNAPMWAEVLHSLRMRSLRAAASGTLQGETALMPKHYIVLASAEEQQKAALILAKHMSQSASPDQQGDLREAAQAALDAMTMVGSIVGCHYKRESEAPANHQEFQVEAANSLHKFNSALTGLCAALSARPEVGE